MMKPRGYNKEYRPNHEYLRYKVEDIENRLYNLIEIAELTAIDNETMTATAKAKAGELTGLKVFMLATGSGDYQQWIPPVVGDKVLLLSDSGNLNHAFCLPIRLPAAFDSNINPGAITRAGDLTIHYDKTNNTYQIAHGSRTLTLDEDSIEIKNNSRYVRLEDNNIELKNGSTRANLTTNEIKLETGASDITLSNSGCEINVPGGLLEISTGSLSFNGQEVHRG